MQPKGQDSLHIHHNGNPSSNKTTGETSGTSGTSGGGLRIKYITPPQARDALSRSQSSRGLPTSPASTLPPLPDKFAPSVIPGSPDKVSTLSSSTTTSGQALPTKAPPLPTTAPPELTKKPIIDKAPAMIRSKTMDSIAQQQQPPLSQIPQSQSQIPLTVVPPSEANTPYIEPPSPFFTKASLSDFDGVPTYSFQHPLNRRDKFTTTSSTTNLISLSSQSSHHPHIVTTHTTTTTTTTTSSTATTTQPLLLDLLPSPLLSREGSNNNHPVLTSSNSIFSPASPDSVVSNHSSISLSPTSPLPSTPLLNRSTTTPSSPTFVGATPSSPTTLVLGNNNSSQSSTSTLNSLSNQISPSKLTFTYSSASFDPRIHKSNSTSPNKSQRFLISNSNTSNKNNNTMNGQNPTTDSRLSNLFVPISEKTEKPKTPPGDSTLSPKQRKEFEDELLQVHTTLNQTKEKLTEKIVELEDSERQRHVLELQIKALEEMIKKYNIMNKPELSTSRSNSPISSAKQSVTSTSHTRKEEDDDEAIDILAPLPAMGKSPTKFFGKATTDSSSSSNLRTQSNSSNPSEGKEKEKEKEKEKKEEELEKSNHSQHSNDGREIKMMDDDDDDDKKRDDDDDDGNESDLEASRSGKGRIKSTVKERCAVENCLSLAAREKYCLRHGWKNDLVWKEASNAQKVARELISTERSYQKGLGVAVKTFLKRLQISTEMGKVLVSQPRLESLFSNIEDIYALSTTICEDLEDLLDKGDIICKQICLTLLHYARRFKIYQIYLQNYDDAIKDLELLKKESVAFNEFLILNERAEGQSLESFLILPVQRLPRYVLLLNELIKQSPADDPARIEMVTSLERMKGIADKINTSLRMKKNQDRVRAIEAMFEKDASFEDIYTPIRVLLRTGQLKKKFSKGSLHLGSHTTYQFFLFNDALVYASFTSGITNNKQRFKMKHMYGISELKVTESYDPQLRQKLIVLNFGVKVKKMEVFATESKEHEEWLKAFQGAVDDLIKSRKEKRVDNFDGGEAARFYGHRTSKVAQVLGHG